MRPAPESPGIVQVDKKGKRRSRCVEHTFQQHKESVLPQNRKTPQGKGLREIGSVCRFELCK